MILRVYLTSLILRTGGVGRCAVGVVVFGVGGWARGTRGVVWERHGLVRVA